MYAEKNFKSKKAFKQAVKDGERIRLFCPGIGTPKSDGIEFVEGPHYPQPHTWYAQVKVESGIVVGVK